MNRDPFPFDPALEELLHEVARDPRSSLLRVGRPARPARLTDSWEALSRWTPGLTLAEREILDVYRAEFATLMLQRWAAEIELRPPPRLFIARASTASKPAPPLDLEAIRVEAERLATLDQQAVGASELRSLLESAQPLTSEQMTSMVTTAVRFHPTTVARIYEALDLVRSGQPRSALRVLHRLLKFEWRPELRSICYQNIALAHGDSWNPVSLLECYRRACAAPNPHLDSLAGWLLFATQFGDVDSAKEAAEGLDSLFDPGDARIERHVAQQARTQHEGRWSARAGVESIIDDLMGTVGPTARKVLSALL